MDAGDRRAWWPAVGFALAFATQAVLMLVLAGGIPAPTLALAGSLGVAAAAAATNTDAFSRLRGMARADMASWAAAGVALGWLAPYIVASHRYTDAPPGSEVLFFIAPVWGAVACVLAAWRLARAGRWWAAAGVSGGALAALAGSAGVVANWERPSSFSPLIRFPAEEVWMVVAGAVFLVGAWRIAKLEEADPGGTGPGRLLAGLSAAGAGLVFWLFGGGHASALATAAGSWPGLVLWAIAFALACHLMPAVLSASGPATAGALMFAPPVLMSGLTFLEQQVGVAGPQPLLLPAVAASSVLVIAGAWRVVASDRAGDESGPGLWQKVAAWIAAAALAVAVAGLFLPAIQATARGGQTPDVQASVSWTLPGMETVGGWVAVALALLALAAAHDRRPWPAVAALCSIPAGIVLGSTPLHVLNGWLPSELQQDFGTEYAGIWFDALGNRAQYVALAGAGVALAVVLTAWIGSKFATRARRGPESGSEVE